MTGRPLRAQSGGVNEPPCAGPRVFEHELRSDPHITSEDLQRGQRPLVRDAAWASIIGSLYGSVILVGFAPVFAPDQTLDPRERRRKPNGDRMKLRRRRRAAATPDVNPSSTLHRSDTRSPASRRSSFPS